MRIGDRDIWMAAIRQECMDLTAKLAELATLISLLDRARCKARTHPRKAGRRCRLVWPIRLVQPRRPQRAEVQSGGCAGAAGAEARAGSQEPDGAIVCCIIAWRGSALCRVVASNSVTSVPLDGHPFVLALTTVLATPSDQFVESRLPPRHAVPILQRAAPHRWIGRSRLARPGCRRAAAGYRPATVPTPRCPRRSAPARG